MRRETLLDFFRDIAQYKENFLVYDDGYRSRTYTYAQLANAAHAFSRRLRESGIGKEDKVLIWSENRPEWIVALWGCLLEGAIVVPVDYRASIDLLRRVHSVSQARLLLVGDEVPGAPLETQTPGWRLSAIEWSDFSGRPEAADLRKDDIAEILFTSGATADPKGVVITHRNVLANIVPVEREVLKYRKYSRPFAPIRFLNLLPLSHMFGQAMAAFIPPMLPGIVVFMRGHNPAEIIRQIKSRRVSVLVCVPKILDVLREHVVRVFPEAAESPKSKSHWLLRWWRYRKIHRLFGFKFWSFVVGAAPLDPDLEEFWSRLGFVVIQGYGLTETAPIVSLNHPFRTRKGTVGKPIAGVEVKISPEGEILVRGENVTSGYYNAKHDTAEAFQDGWFHTGDMGTIDESGQLYIRGRKKEMIVTPEGLNVFPEDVERILNEQEDVEDSAVVGVADRGEERVHAVLVLRNGADPNEIVRRANARLEDHQKIRAASVWPRGELPRTEGTGKLKRREVQQWVASGGAPRGAKEPSKGDVESVVARYAPNRDIAPETTLEELGLSSLERIELLMALESRFQTTIDESAYTDATSMEDLRRLVTRSEIPGGGERTSRQALSESIEFPSWNRAAPARLIRRFSLPTWILPLGRIFIRVRGEGLENLRGVEPPVIFAANHQSHFDVPAILMALPSRWRYRVAPAMSKEFFSAHFFPKQHGRREWFTNSLGYYLASTFFNAYPFPQREAGARQTLRYSGELATEGQCILIFPEGRITDTGEIGKFQPGVGMMASRLGVPVIPIRLEGLEKVLHRTWMWPRPGRVGVKFGPSLRLEGEDYAALAKRVEDAVRAL